MPSTVAPEGLNLIVRLYDTVRAVKVHKTRLSDLARHCDNQLSIVREYSPLYVGAEVDIIARANVIERAVERVLVRVSDWARLTNVTAFLKQNEIQNGIEDCHRELAACTNRFMVALSTVTRKESEIQEMARQRDHQQMLDKIAELREGMQILDKIADFRLEFREEMQKRGRSITLEAPKWHELLLQTGVVEVDGQGDVPPVSADCGYFKTSWWFSSSSGTFSPLSRPVVASMAISRTAVRQADAQAPIRRRETDSPSFGFTRLPPQALRDHPDIQGLFSSVSTSISRWSLSVDVSSSQSTSRMIKTNERGPFPFAPSSTRSQTILDTFRSSNNDLPLPGFTSNSGHSSFISSRTSFSSRCNFSNASENDYKSIEKNSEASFDCLSLQSISSAGESNIRRRSQTSCIILPQSCDWESVAPVGLDLLEEATTDSESSLQTAKDGTVLAGNLEGFVSQVISEIADSSRNGDFRETFLTIYQIFATSKKLFNILKRRFETSPATVDSRYLILLFIERWLKKGFGDGDEELECSSMIQKFILALAGGSESISEKLKLKAGEIASLIEDRNYDHLSQPMCCPLLRGEYAVRPEEMTPADLAVALAVVAGARFKCITYWDYVNFTRKRSNVERIKAFKFVHGLVTLWVQTTIVQADSIDERMKVYEEWIYTAERCRALNDFSSTSAIVVALMSKNVTMLPLTCESNAMQVLYALAKELRPTNGVYQSTLKTVATNNLIPWLDLHLNTLYLTANSNLIVEVDGHPLIDFKQCSEVAEQIEVLVQYSPCTPDTARPDVLAYVEYSLKSSDGGDTQRSAEERSVDLAIEELEQQNSGFAWSTP